MLTCSKCGALTPTDYTLAGLCFDCAPYPKVFKVFQFRNIEASFPRYPHKKAV